MTANPGSGTTTVRDRASIPRKPAETRPTSHDRVPTRLDANNASEPRPFVEALVGNLEPTFNALLGAVAFVLLIACANVAALFLSRLTSRQKEIAVRRSLGATRGQVVRQFIAESFVFSAIAGASGTLLALWALSAIKGAFRVRCAYGGNPVISYSCVVSFANTGRKYA